MKILSKALLSTVLFMSIFSCTKDDNMPTTEPRGNYENGILISNEGNFGQGNASVTYVSNDFQTVENNIFSNVNSQILGDTAQSMAFNDDLAYIVLNVSNKIEVVNRYTFQSVATIDIGLSNPRFMVIVNGKGYVSNWGDFTPSDDDYIAVINLATNTVEKMISSSYLPEELIAKDNKVFVATGIFGFGNHVDVIDAIADELQTSITVGNSPNSMELDSNGDLWVLSSENLVKINTNLNTVVKTLEFNANITAPNNLSFDGQNFYVFDSGSVYKFNESTTALPTTSEFDSVNFYDMKVRNGLLYGLDAADFASNGSLKVYDLNTNTQTQSIAVGIIPGEVYFND